MKKKRLYKNRKKHAYGTPVTNYIENPGTELAENRIDLAQARHKAATNPWVQGTAIAGHAISQNADLIAGGLGNMSPNGKGDRQVSDQYTSEAGITTAGTGGPVGATEVGMEFQNSADYKNIYAFGGQTSNVPVEVDGGEVAETPEGELMEFQGPDHEQGGVDVNLPPGTDIYSKRLRVGGKTLAQRKKDRERKLNRVTKQLEKNPSDSVLKNTFKRVQENNAKEEANDQALQEKVNAEMEAQGREYAYGTSEDGVPPLKRGDIFEGTNPNAGITKKRWVDSSDTEHVDDFNWIDYKDGSNTGKVDSIIDPNKLYPSKYQIDDEGNPLMVPRTWAKHIQGTKTKLGLSNDVDIRWFDGTAKEHKKLLKNLNRSNWTGAHGFRGKNWESQIVPKEGQTYEEAKEEFKKENPFFEAGRSRHIEYTIDGANSSRDVSYTHKNKKAYGGKVEKFPDGGTVPPYGIPKTKADWQARVESDISEEEYQFLSNMDQSIYKKGGSNYVEPQKNIDFKQVNHPLSGVKNTSYNVSDAYPEAPGNIMAGTSNDGVEFNPSSPEGDVTKMAPRSMPTLAENREGFTEPIPNAITEAMPGESLPESNAPVNTAKERFLKAMNYTPSASEALGIAGQIYSGVKPMQTTLANRATDSANVNEFKNFGQDALAAIEAQKGFVAQQEARKLQDIESQRLSALKRGRNSARSANTQRALDLASTQGANKASGMARSQSAKEMMAILNSQAQAETMQDRMVMQGEQNRDLADREDKDNFYTQLSNNQVNLGSSMQAISKNLGKIASNNEKRNLINSRSTVFMLDKKGNITTKDGRKLGEEELKKAVQDLGLDKEEVEEDK